MEPIIQKGEVVQDKYGRTYTCIKVLQSLGGEYSYRLNNDTLKGTQANRESGAIIVDPETYIVTEDYLKKNFFKLSG